MSDNGDGGGGRFAGRVDVDGGGAHDSPTNCGEPAIFIGQAGACEQDGENRLPYQPQDDQGYYSLISPATDWRVYLPWLIRLRSGCTFAAASPGVRWRPGRSGVALSGTHRWTTSHRGQGRFGWRFQRARNAVFAVLLVNSKYADMMLEGCDGPPPIEPAWRRFCNGPRAELLRKSIEARPSYLRFIKLDRLPNEIVLPGAIGWNLVALLEARARGERTGSSISIEGSLLVNTVRVWAAYWWPRVEAMSELWYGDRPDADTTARKDRSSLLRIRPVQAR
jgi:hypothetical protein